MKGDGGDLSGTPHHPASVAGGNGERNLRRRIQRGAGMRQAAQRTSADMRGRRARLIIQTALLAYTVADDGCGQRIGHGLARRPAGGNRRQHLHHQGEQDQGQVFL